MYDYEKQLMEKGQAKYQKLYRSDFSGSGIFVKKKRKQLLGLEAKSGGKNNTREERKRKTLANFWYDVRENVRYGIVDLQLFIETSGEENINKVLDSQSLKPVFDVFFSRDRPHNDDDISSKAKVAHMLVESGLNYLRSTSQPYLRKKENQEIDDAIELSQQLMYNLLTNEEKHSVVWKEIMEKAKEKDV